MMSKINWKEELGWDEENLEELRLTGFAYIRQGKYDIALTIFRALHVLNPNDLYDLQTMGALLVQTKEPEEAIVCLERALQLEGDHTATLINLCKAFFMLHKVEEGLKLANVLKDDPDPTVSSMARALLLAFSREDKR